MTTSMNTLPPRPDLGPPQVIVLPPQRRRIWPIVAAVAGGLIVLGAIGSVIDAPTETTPTTVTPVESTALTPDEAATIAGPLLTQATDELGFITATSAISEDIIHLNNTADLVEQAAAAWDGVDDTEAGYLHSAADHARTAALTWPDAASSRELTAGADDLDASVDYMEANYA